MIEFDEIGPEIVMQVSDARVGLRGCLVIDNTTLGPGKGGVRLAQNVSPEEVFRLARAMTWKNALAELPFGGAKSGIDCAPNNPHEVDKNALIRAFARRIKEMVPKHYVAGPDMNTGEHEMQEFAEEVGTPKAATGKPAAMGGLPHELGSTGFGVAKSALATLELMKIPSSEATFAIEGFGNVGTFAARFLTESCARIVAVSDSRGTIYDKHGLDVEKLIRVKQDAGMVTAYDSPTAKKLGTNDLFGLDVTVLVPGARPDAINASNKHAIKAKLIVEAANIPIPESIEEEFWKKGIVFAPDIIANAGGVISSWVEFEGGTKEKMFKEVEARVTRNTRIVMKRALETKTNPRKIAMHVARERIEAAMKKAK